MLETQNLDKLQQLNPVISLNLQQKGLSWKRCWPLHRRVKRSIMFFEPQPLCVTRESFKDGRMKLSMDKTLKRGITQQPTRWMQPLPVKIKLLCVISVSGKHKQCYAHGKKAEIKPWHTQDPKELSSSETSTTKIRQTRSRSHMRCSRSCKLEQSRISDSELDGNDTQVGQK